MAVALYITVLVAYFAVMIYIGIRSRKSANSVGGFVLGGRTAGPWLSAFAYGTSYFSAVIFIGYAGQFGWEFGIAATWIGIGNAVIGSLLAWAVLGRRTRIMAQQLDSATMPDFFGKRFGDDKLKIAASIIIFIFLIPYTASLYKGLGSLFAMAFDIPYFVCIIIMAVVTAVYVLIGGYMATAWNDFIQGIIMLVGIVAVVIAVLANAGGFTEAINSLSQIGVDGSSQQGAYTSFFGPDLYGLLMVIILTSLGTWGLPQMVQKFYAIRSEKAIHKGAVISTLFAVVVAGGCYFLGGFGRLYGDRVNVAADGYDAIIPAMLENLSPLLIGIVVILVLSASMSTLSSLVMASSSTLTLDLLKDNVVKDMDEKKQVLTMRGLIVVFIAISVVIAIVQHKSNITFIAQLMGVSWGALAGAFLAPFLYGIYWKRVTRAAVWASFACGVGLTVGNLFFHFIDSAINAGAAAMVLGLVVVPVVSLITPRQPEERLREIFSCYEEKTVLHKKMVVGTEKDNAE